MLVCFRDSRRILCDLPEKRLRLFAHLFSASGVNQAIARDMQQPRLRFVWHSFGGPSVQRRDQSIAEGVFCASDVARASGEISDEAAIRILHYGFNCLASRFTHQLTRQQASQPQIKVSNYTSTPG